MRCINCGNELSDGAKFCPRCGASQSGGAAPYKQAAPEPMFRQPEYFPDDQAAGQPLSAPAGKKPVLKIILIAAGVLVLAAIIVGIIFLVRACHKFDRDTPEKAVNAAVTAINEHNSRELLKSVPQEYRNNLLDGMLGSDNAMIAKLFVLNDNGDYEDEVYDMADSALKLINRKLGVKIDFKNARVVSEEGETGGASGNKTVKGNLYLGDTDLGELIVYLREDGGSWYIYNVDGRNINQAKLTEVESPLIKKILVYTMTTTQSNSYNSGSSYYDYDRRP